MSNFSKAIGRVISGGTKAFSRFPAAMASALVVAVAATINIAVEPTNEKLLVNLMLAFASAAFWGMAVSVISNKLSDKKLSFAILNSLSLIAGFGLFAYLQYWVPDEPKPIIIARIFAAGVAAFIIFLITISANKAESDFNQSSFMVLKSFIIAGLYTLVIMLGLFFVAFAVENLLYENMDEKVYMYISIWSAFIGFAFFLGYFPSFKRQQHDNHLETAQKHPAFIEILFAFVLVPIMAVMTLVLLIWSIQILIGGDWPEFKQLSAIFTVYILFGVFQSVMMAHYDKATARMFRRIFPFTALVFLAFEAYALTIQFADHGIRSNEYFIGILWIFGLLSTLALLLRPVKRTLLIAFVALVLTILAVLPITGYQALPLSSQTKRLQAVLNRNNMLIDGRIVKAPAGISLDDRITITDSALYIMRESYDDTAKASWLSEQLDSSKSFVSVFGFEPEYDAYPSGPDDKVLHEIHLYLPAGSINITGYTSSLLIGEQFYGAEPFSGQIGEYAITFVNMSGSKIPSIQIRKDDVMIAQQNLEAWLMDLQTKYMTEDGRRVEPDFEDMTYRVEGSGVELLVVFRDISIYDSTGEGMEIFLAPTVVYFKETP